MYLEKPEDFNETPLVIVSCFVEYKNKILLLLRQDHKKQPNTYWVPAGKTKNWEKIHSAMIRELLEETSIEARNLTYNRTVYVRYPEYDFEYHMFEEKLIEEPQIKINPDEHKWYIWSEPIISLQEPLIPDLDACIRLHYKL